ncbi:7367_t:CDS:10 [Funneliformis caledonium]|uniref:ATP-dependent DNA helicase II subunit 1 n=2 Tax=Funneliformis TaxID=1117308 RepID=A0A9N9AJ91_9GLOM|nr:7367_t:CDS:10 [Funneliformis caledonium]
MSSSNTISSSWASFSDKDQDEFDAEEDIGEEEKMLMTSNRDAVIFVIDASFSMMKKNHSDGIDEAVQVAEIPFRSAIQCISEVMTSKLLSDNTSDLIGVMFMGTKKSSNTLQKEHIYVLHNLDSPDIQRVKELNNIGSGEVDFDNEYGSTDEEYPIGDVFWICSELFNKETSKTLKTKRIFLITDQDNPHTSNPVLRSTAITRARDLTESGIQINLFSLNKLDHTFNFNAFYSVNINLMPAILPSSFKSNILIILYIFNLNKEIIQSDEIDEIPYYNAQKNFESLVSQIMAKESPRRSLFSIPFRLFGGDEGTPELTIGIKGYAMVIEKKKPLARMVHMRSETTRLAESRTKYVCMDTTQELMSDDIKYCYEYGGEKIAFTKAEVAELRRFGQKGLTLIGFKPSSVVKLHYNIEHPLFLYPDEGVSSRRTFAALHRKMLEMDKVAICYFVKRDNSLPSFVALKAQAEKLGEEKRQLIPPGLNMIHLPFVDDIRPLPPHAEITSAPDEMIDLLKPIVDKLHMKDGFDPSKFNNPEFIRFYDVLQSMAFDKEIPLGVEDSTVPKFATINKRVGKIIEAFNHEADQRSVELLANQMTIQSKKSTSRGTRGATRGTNSSESSNVDIKSLWEKGKATVDQLKAYIQATGAKPARLKADLINQIEGILSSN